MFFHEVTESATNLKEVVVTFDGTVDEETATDKASYSLKSGKAIKSVALAADEKTVTITLAEGSTLTNNKVEALTVSNVKAGDKVINEKNIEFTVADNAIPTVTEVKSLGTKSLKVVFSEPVNDVQQSNFTLDGKAYFGKVKATGNEVILTPYDTNALAVGNHTVVVEKVKDFANFTSLRASLDFTVAEDKNAPTIVEASATLEKVTIKFSEEVDDETVAASKVYWKSGSDKKTADSFEQLSSTEFEFTFVDEDSLPTGSIDVFVEGVKDYSGNEIAKDTKVSVSPVVDQTRPEVKKVKVVSATKLEVQFSKVVEEDSAEKTANYTVLDKDGKVIPVKSATADGSLVTVELYSELSTGNNKLTVKNVKDNTKLKNTMLDYSETFTKADTKAPSIDSKVANSTDRRVVIGFDEKMDVSTLTNYSNYLVEIDGQLQALTSDIADISVLQDGKVLTINFVEKIGSKKVQFANLTDSAVQTQVKKLHVLSVKDLAGNLLSNFATNDTSNVIDLSSTSTTLSVEKATLVDTKTVELKFNAGIVSASKDAITGLTGTQKVSSIEVSGTSTIKVKFNDAFAPNKGDVDFGIDATKLVTLAGNGSGTLTVANSSVVDKVSPSLVKVDPIALKTGGGNDDTFVVTFDEALNDAALVLLASDLEIRANGVVLESYDYTVATGTANDNKFEVTVTKNGVKTTDVTVTLLNDRYIQDAAGNAANKFTNVKLKAVAGDFLAESAAPEVNATLTKVSDTQVKVSFNEKVTKATAETLLNYALSGTGSLTGNPTKAVLDANGKDVLLTVADMSGLTTGQTVIVTVSNVEDVADNVISTTNVATFTK